jgi:hypothetical protein
MLEVTELRSFVDGMIMVPDVRAHLHKSWGFCPRHTWLEAVVECELRVRPHGTSLLYEDLTTRAAAQLSSGGRRNLGLRRLRSRASCYTCDYLQLTHRHLPDGVTDGVVAPGTAAAGGRAPNASATRREATRPATTIAGATERVNRRRRMRTLVAGTRSEWEPRSCPLCLGGDGPVCRPHLFEGADAPLEPIGVALGDLAERLARYAASMAWGGRVPTPNERASWVEALGWFAGWDYPAALLAIDGEARS